MAQETASGAALFRRTDGALHFLAVESRSQRGYWGLVKGHVEEGETIAQAARREIAEEVGLRGLTFLSGFREEVRYRLPSGDDKVVYYFLADAGTGEIHLQAEELADYRWLPFPAVCELFTFPEAGRVVERAARYLEDAGEDREPAEHALTRPHVAALDEILGRRLDVLDDGFVRVVDYLGNDAAIVQAARVSYGEGTRRVSDDRGLIRYLMRHRHTTPFEMCELKLHVRVPMDAWRQWIRHRTASVNEISTRYSIAIDAAQATSPAEWRTQAAGNRQGSGESLDRSVGERLSDAEAELQRQAREVYQERLDAGVAREQARKDLPLSTYTEAYWKIDLHNLLHFLLLRLDDHAQLEIRHYAQVIGAEVVARWCPLAWEAFCDYRLHTTSLSRIETELVSRLAAGDVEAAVATARAAGWLSERKGQPGRLARNRERAEAEAKLCALGLPAPWGNGSAGKGRPAAGVD
jgi:thymidylate synthase (FAD)